MTHILDRLSETIEGRKGADPEQSYSASLLALGAEGASAKFKEEAGEFVRALMDEDKARVTSEAADVIYHLLVALASREVTASDVWKELERREGTSGHAEKASR